MANANLMTPLFYQDNFNVAGKKIRAVFLREVTNGTDSYRLWRRDGKPDRQYPQGKGDDYILYVELHGYLATLRTTDYYLVDRCGYQAMVAALYGGEDKREQYFDGLRRSGGDEAVLEVLRQEEQKIQELGRDPACQADYIKAILDGHVSTYLASRENGGETFPDFVDDQGRQVLNQTYDESRWARAAAAAKDVMDLGVYKLYTASYKTKGDDVYPATIAPPYHAEYSTKDFPDGWADIDPFESYRAVFNGDLYASENPELIFTRGTNSIDDGIKSLVLHQLPSNAGGDNNHGLTIKQVDAYGMADGSAFDYETFLDTSNWLSL